LASRFPPEQCAKILRLCGDSAQLDAMPVNEFTDMFANDV